MGDKKIHIKIVTPYELFYEGDADQIVLTAIDGEIGIRPGHDSVIIALNPGEIRLTKGNEVSYISAADGYAKIEIDNVVVVVGSAEWPEQIDVERAKQALERAEAHIHSPGSTKQEILRGIRGVLRAKSRIKVSGESIKGRKY